MINREETDEVVSRSIEYDFFVKLILTVVALSIFYIFHSISSIVHYLSDDSIPVVSCPRVYNLDAPVVMGTIESGKPIEKDRWVRGFIRRFILGQFPRTKDDVEIGFKYVINHSTGDVKAKYESLHRDADEISELIKDNNYKFYPKVSDGGYDIRVRSDEKEKTWMVEIDGFLIKKMNNNEERYFPTLKYKIVTGKATLTNPEGLYVEETEMERITDYVSRKKEKL